MANKIDKINVDGADYDINLPTTATPSITSLTVTGNLTVSGTANLSAVSCIGASFSINYDDGHVVEILDSDYTQVADAGIGTYDMGSFEVYGKENLYLLKGSYTCSVPDKSGTLALTSDIPVVARGNFSATIGMKVNDSVDTSITFPSTGNWDVVATSDKGTVVMSVICLTTSGCTIRGTRWHDDHLFGNNETINVHWIAVKY